MAHLIDPATVRSAVELAGRAPSVHNSQPWRWRIDRHSVHLFADRDRWLPATDPDGRDLMISCGAALHHLLAALAACGVGATVRRIPNPAEPDHLAALDLHERAPRTADIRLAAAIPLRRTDRRRFGAWAVPAVFVEELLAGSVRHGAQLFPVTGPHRRAVVLDALQQAQQRQHATLGYRLETALWTGLQAADDGIPAGNLLHTEPDPDRDVARRFRAGVLEQADTDRDHALLLVLATGADDALARLRAGEALSAVLLHATDLGLASCPLSQPTEVAALNRVLRDELLGGTGTPQLILRVGWAAGRPLPPTPRRTLADQLDPRPG